jgi:hypothetical protein
LEEVTVLALEPIENRVYKKVLVQASYHANLLAVHKAPEICQEWLSRSEREMFPQWSVGPSIVELKNDRVYRKFYVAAKSSGASWENLLPGELKHQLQLAGNFLADLGNAVPGLQAVRFGVRFFYLLRCGDFDELRRALLHKCTRWESFAAGFEASDADVSVSWQFDADGARVNATVGPVKQDELDRFFDSASPDAVPGENAEQFLPKAALLFDGDYGVRDQPVANCRRIIADAQKVLDGKFECFVRLLRQIADKE